MSSRRDKAIAFLETTDWAGQELCSLAGDASARRYFRINSPRSAILMDAPIEDGQDIQPFIKVAQFLTKNGLSAPNIFAEDPNNGFLLLEDLGDGVFAREIEKLPNKELELYRAATEVLVTLEKLQPPASLPHFDANALANMIEPAFTWYRRAIIGSSGDSVDLQACLAKALSHIEGSVVSLRDFHAENLIWLADRVGTKRVGLLDFQDAMIGPKGYDLISLLYDARRDVSEKTIETIMAEYALISGLHLKTARVGWAALTLQRNLRILGIFARLALKMGKSRYLDFLPRVWRYVELSAAHPGLERLGAAVHAALPPPTQETIEELRSRCGSVPDR